MAEGDRYAAVGGTVTTPFSTISIEAGAVERQTLNVRNVTGPGDSGNTRFSHGNKQYGFSLRGHYAEAATATDTTDTGDIIGEATIQLGNGETWSGDVLITRYSVASQWTVGGDQVVDLSGVFTGAVTIAQPA